MEKSQEEIEFENEMRIREMLKIWFNETIEDFESVDEYNDYLELIEDVGRLTSGTEAHAQGGNRGRPETPRVCQCEKRAAEEQAAEGNEQGLAGQL